MQPNGNDKPDQQAWIKSFRAGTDPIAYFKAVYAVQGSASTASAVYRNAFAREQTKAFLSLFDMLKILDRRPAGSPPSCLNEALEADIKSWNTSINAALDVLDGWSEEARSKISGIVYPPTPTGGSSGATGVGTGTSTQGAVATTSAVGAGTTTPPAETGTKLLEMEALDTVTVNDRIFLAPAQTVEQLYLASSMSPAAEQAVGSLYGATDVLKNKLAQAGTGSSGCDPKPLIETNNAALSTLRDNFPLQLPATSSYAAAMAGGRKGKGSTSGTGVEMHGIR